MVMEEAIVPRFGRRSDGEDMNRSSIGEPVWVESLFPKTDDVPDDAITSEILAKARGQGTKWAERHLLAAWKDGKLNRGRRPGSQAAWYWPK